jgi:hypothetical protein
MPLHSTNPKALHQQRLLEEVIRAGKLFSTKAFSFEMSTILEFMGILASQCLTFFCIL